MPAKLSNIEALAVMRASDFEPLLDYPGSVKPWKSKCLRCGEIVQPRLNAVKSGRRQCGYCSGARIQDADAIKTMEESGLLPLENFPGGNKKWKNKCKDCKRIVFPTYANIKNGHAGCAYCSGKKIDPQTAREFMISKFLEPLEPFKSSRSKWKCKCLICDSTVNPSYGDVKQEQGGCVRCGQIQTANKNRLGGEFAVSKMHQAGVEPLGEYQGYDVPWRSRCMSCKREVSPRLHSIISGQGACKYCSGNEVDPEFAEKVMEEAGLIVCEPFPGSSTPWKSVCKECKRSVSPRYGNVRKGAGCKFCNAISFQAGKPSIVYLITNAECGAHKIGVANRDRKKKLNQTTNPRLIEHISQGWKVYKQIEFESGLTALEVEQGVLTWLRNVKNLSAYLSKDQMPQGGHTETVDAIEIDLPTIWAKVEELSRGI